MKHIGIVCSLLIAYRNAMDYIAKKENAKESQHVGTVGVKLNFYGTVKNIQYWPNNFGTTTAIFFEDSEGNIILWKASRDPELEKGVAYEVTGKVKNHSDFRGRSQTEVNYCKVLGVVGAIS